MRSRKLHSFLILLLGIIMLFATIAEPIAATEMKPAKVVNQSPNVERFEFTEEQLEMLKQFVPEPQQLVLEASSMEDNTERAQLMEKLKQQELNAVKSKRLLAYTFTKEEIERLLLDGTTEEELYLSYYWGNELQVEPAKLLEEVYSSKKSWSQIEKNAAASVNKTSSSSTKASEQNISDKIGTNQSSGLQALVSTVDSVLDGLITQEMINQTNKPQYSDRSGSSEQIDPVTGKLTWSQTNITLPGRDGLDLNVGVMYDSNQAYSYMKHSNSSGGLKKYNYLISRYDLGLGFAFQFPSVQLADGYMYYHDGHGAVYRIFFNSSDSTVSYTNLVGYQGKDLRFLRDTSGTFTNGQAVSAYYLEYADKKKEYFSSDGILLGIKDRYDNTITFKHQNRVTYDGQTNKVISSITDTVGRTVRFDYETTLQTPAAEEDDSFEGERIVVSVYDANNVKVESITYLKYRHLLNFNGNFDGYAPYLREVKDQLSVPTQFVYSSKASYFSKNSKTQTSGSGRYNNNLLTAVYYNSSWSDYSYAVTSRNWGAYGFSEEYRISGRKDHLHQLNFDAPLVLYNNRSYSYSGDYTGYPTYTNPSALPVSYLYSSTATVINSTTGTNGLAIRSEFNGKGQQTLTEAQASNGEKVITRQTGFHSTYSYKPISLQKETYASGDTAANAEILKKEISYMPWGGVASETEWLTPSEMASSATKDWYTTSYTYDSTYYFPLTVKWYQQLTGSISTEAFAYYTNGRLKSFTNAEGEITNYCYYVINANQQTINNCSSPTQAINGKLSKVVETRALGNGQTSRQETTYTAIASYAYPEKVTSQMTTRNEQGQTVTEEVSKTMQYNMGTGRLLKEIDGAQNTTEYSYDALGRVTSIKYPVFTNLNNEKYALVDEYTYSQSYVPQEAILANSAKLGVKVDYRRKYTKQSNQNVTYLSTQTSYYDGFGQLLYDKAIDGSTSQIQQYVYNDQGQVSLSIDPQQNQLEATYDAWGNLKETKDAYGNLSVAEQQLKARKTNYYFVAANQVNAYRANPTQDSLKSNYVEQQYDERGLVKTVTAYQDWPARTQPVRESYTYDLAGNVTGYIDPNANLNSQTQVTTSYQYDQLNRLKTVRNALDQIVNYTYDANGMIVKATIQAGTSGAPQIIYNKTYTETGDLAKKADGLNKADQYGYNQLGLLSNSKDRNATAFTYQYDEQYRQKLKQATGTDGQTQQTRYIVGKDTILTDKVELYNNNVLSSTMTTAIDTMKRVSSQVISSGSFSAYTGLSYDLNNRVTMVTSGNTTGTFATRYTYDKTRLSKVQVNGQQTANSTTANNVSYAYYANGQLQSITYPPLADQSILKTEYSYNALGRMTSMQNKKGSVVMSSTAYTYDKNGNILSSTQAMKDQSTVTSNYTYDKLNRLTGITSSDGSQVSYSYDLRGNRKTVQDNRGWIIDLNTKSWHYDLENRLIQVDKGAETTSFEYGANRLRFKKQTPQKTTYYRYNTNGEVIAEVDSNQQVLANYVRGDRLLVKKEAATGKDYYYLYNGHGDVIQLVDRSGNIVNRYSYDEWGNVRERVEGTENSFLYAGEQYDQETGLYYLRARYYDPRDGRFINEDTYEGQISNPLSLNLYTYVENNPLIYVDPTGHWKESDNEELRLMTQGYSEEWRKAYARGDKKGMSEAEKNADQVRVGYYNMFGLDIPNDVKYTSVSNDYEKMFRMSYFLISGMLLPDESFFKGNSHLTTKNFIDNPELTARIGYQNVKQMFINEGYKVDAGPLKSGNGMRIIVGGHSTINSIQYHNDQGSRHPGTAYIKINGNNLPDGIKTIKVVIGEMNQYKGNIKEEQKAGTRFVWYPGPGGMNRRDRR